MGDISPPSLFNSTVSHSNPLVEEELPAQHLPSPQAPVLSLDTVAPTEQARSATTNYPAGAYLQAAAPQAPSAGYNNTHQVGVETVAPPVLPAVTERVELLVLRPLRRSQSHDGQRSSSSDALYGARRPSESSQYRGVWGRYSSPSSSEVSRSRRRSISCSSYSRRDSRDRRRSTLHDRRRRSPSYDRRSSSTDSYSLRGRGRRHYCRDASQDRDGGRTRRRRESRDRWRSPSRERRRSPSRDRYRRHDDSRDHRSSGRWRRDSRDRRRSLSRDRYRRRGDSRDGRSTGQRHPPARNGGVVKSHDTNRRRESMSPDDYRRRGSRNREQGATSAYRGAGGRTTQDRHKRPRSPASRTYDDKERADNRGQASYPPFDDGRSRKEDCAEVRSGLAGSPGEHNGNQKGGSRPPGGPFVVNFGNLDKEKEKMEVKDAPPVGRTKEVHDDVKSEDDGFECQLARNRVPHTIRTLLPSGFEPAENHDLLRRFHHQLEPWHLCKEIDDCVEHPLYLPWLETVAIQPLGDMFGDGGTMLAPQHKNEALELSSAEP